MTKSFYFRSWFIGQLRRMYRRYPPYYQCLNEGKEEYFVLSKKGKQMRRVKLTCAECRKSFKSTEIQVDHKIPVIDPVLGFPLLPDGSDDWNAYLKRYYCDISNLQRLCKPCHVIKTGAENKIRVKKPRKSRKKT